MRGNGTSKLAEIVRNETRELLAEWMEQQCAADTLRSDLMNERELREQSSTSCAPSARRCSMAP